MPKAVEQQTLQQMRDLCAQISVAHDLDETIQEELRGHMEDKLLAYLSGDEPLTEQDAFILVREHFGNPATVKSLMQEAHAGPVRAGLLRRVAAVAIAATALQAVFSWATFPLYVFAQDNALAGTGWLMNSVSALETVVRLLALWLILLRWQRVLAAGRKPWFLRAGPMTLVCVFALLMEVWAFRAVAFFYLISIREIAIPEPVPLADEWFIYARMYVSATLTCLLWLWWCDRPPRTMLSLGAAALAWIVYPVLQLTATFASLCIGDVATGPGSAGANFAGFLHRNSPDTWLGALRVLWFDQRMLSVAVAVGLYLIYRLAHRKIAAEPVVGNF